MWRAHARVCSRCERVQGPVLRWMQAGAELGLQALRSRLLEQYRWGRGEEKRQASSVDVWTDESVV